MLLSNTYNPRNQVIPQEKFTTHIVEPGRHGDQTKIGHEDIESYTEIRCKPSIGDDKTYVALS
jgi:hypothetical protein